MIAAENTGRKAHGFEIKKEFYDLACKWIESNKRIKTEIKELGYAKSELAKKHPVLF